MLPHTLPLSLPTLCPVHVRLTTGSLGLSFSLVLSLSLYRSLCIHNEDNLEADDSCCASERTCNDGYNGPSMLGACRHTRGNRFLMYILSTLKTSSLSLSLSLSLSSLFMDIRHTTHVTDSRVGPSLFLSLSLSLSLFLSASLSLVSHVFVE